jgi:hypothetical protein
MGTIAQLNVEIGASIAPLQAGVEAAKGELTSFGQLSGEIFDQANTSLSQASQQAIATARSYKELQSAAELLYYEQSQLFKGSERWQTYQEAIRKVDAQLNELDGSARSAGAALATVTPSTAQMQPAIQQFQGFNMVLRETHSLGISTTRGLVSMSAIGFPMLAKEISAARSEGQSFGKIFTTLGGQLFTSTAIITLAGSAIAILAHHFLNSKETIDKYRQAVEGMEDTIGKEILSSRALITIAADENQTRGVRLQAVKKLREEYEPYLKGLSDEQILSGQIGDALKQINNALLQKVAMQAGEEKILPILRQQLDLQLKNLELQKTMQIASGITKEAADDAARHGIQTLGILRAQGAGAKIEFDKNTQAVEKLNEQINKMFEGIKGFISGSAALDIGKFTQGKDKVDQIQKALDELKITLEEIRTNGVGNLIKIDTESISAIESTIKRLRDLGVSNEDERIISLRVKISDLAREELPVMMRKLITEIEQKEATDDDKLKIKIPVKISNQVDDKSYDKEFFNLQRNAERIKKDFKALGLDAPWQLDFFQDTKDQNATEDSPEFKRRKKELEYLKTASKEIGQAFGQVFDTLVTKGKLSFDAIGKALIKLIEQLISAVVEAALLSVILSAFGFTSFGGGGIGFSDILGTLTGLTKIKPHADGFIATGPTMFGNQLIGERGGEALIPLNRLSSMLGMNNGGGDKLMTRLTRDEILIWISRGLQSNNRGFGNNNGFRV